MRKNNKKGFTLIELLAVIVVLAIVMVLATTTVLPLMNNMRKSAFADEAIGATNAASTYVTMLTFNNLDRSSITNTSEAAYWDNYKNGVSRYCVTLETLGRLGIYSDKNIDKVVPSTNNNQKPAYEGVVIISTDVTGTGYTYKVVMHNNNYAINGIGSSYETKDVLGYSSSQTKWKCSDFVTDKTSSTLSPESW